MREIVRRRLVFMLSVMILCTGIGSGLLALTADAANKRTGKVNAASISVSVRSLTLKKGERAVIKATVSPAACQEKISFRSSNQKVAVVSSKGEVTAKKAGTAKITVKAGRKKVTVTVRVPRTATEELTGVPAAWRMKQGRKLTLEVKKTPAASDDKITYASSRKSVASITSRGKITARKPGTTVITVKSGKVVKKFTLTVTNAKCTPEEFLRVCEDTARQIALDGRWHWWHSSAPNNWAKAKKSRKTSCCHYISMCMQRAGLLPSGCGMYCRKDGKLIFANPKAKTRKAVFKYFRYISCKRPLDKCDLRPGDVLGLYNGKIQHMTVFAGYDAAGQTLWYDFGSDGTTDPTKIAASGTFRTRGTFNRIQKVGGNDWGKVSFILRLK